MIYLFLSFFLPLAIIREMRNQPSCKMESRAIGASPPYTCITLSLYKKMALINRSIEIIWRVRPQPLPP